MFIIVLLLGELSKFSDFLQVRCQLAYVAFYYHIVNCGLSKSKIFSTNIVIKLAFGYTCWFGVSLSRMHFEHKEDSVRSVVFNAALDCNAKLKLALFYLIEAYWG